MKLLPSSLDQTTRLRNDLKLGLPILLHAKKNVAAVIAVETLRFAFLEKIKSDNEKGLHLVITARRAQTLNATPYDGDIARIAMPEDFSLNWLLAAVNPALDLSNPFKGPFRTMRGGETKISRTAIELCKKGQLLPAALVFSLTDTQERAFREGGFLSHDCDEILEHTRNTEALEEVSAAELTLASVGKSRIHIFRDNSGFSEHCAILIGNVTKNEPVIVRMHSACFTGDVIGSLKCDCGPQLKSALTIIANEKSGIIVYLNQEGRGIGLANKMRAYELQNQGFDTVEANHRLGFEDEERDLRIGAEIIKKLGFKKVKLLTNNPRKIEQVMAMGLEVTKRIDLKTEPNAENANYLSTKALKSGHIL
ncbi:MAG: GTP cyclohydrolase II [Pseudomonadota bacterium]|nr:GTP cyclohydrolase II [Pseudomonadota bacterium]